MKIFFFALLITSLAVHAQELSVGTLSTNQNFAVRNGTSFNNSSLDQYEGKILVVMMMTPWCPFCQSNASAVGSGIIAPFNATSRGSLRGKNNHGIEIDSILLSTEPASNWDSTNSTFASRNGYEQWGLDANAQRQSPRALLGYYRGGFPSGVNSSNLYDWEDDRRRVVVLNMVRNSASHGYRQIIMNQNEFTSSNATNAQALINAITPAPVLTSFASWQSSFTFPVGKSAALADADGDGIVNLREFFHGTHPLQAHSQDPGLSLRRQGNTWEISYRRAKNITGVTANIRQSNNLTTWEPSTMPLGTTITDLGAQEEVKVVLPAQPMPQTYFQLLLTAE